MTAIKLYLDEDVHHLIAQALRLRGWTALTTEPGMPHWTPSLERWCWHAPVDRPALLYTRGLNAGGYSSNVNSVKTEVWIEQP